MLRPNQGEVRLEVSFDDLQNFWDGYLSLEQSSGRIIPTADQHKQPDMDVLDLWPVGGSGAAVCAGDGDEQEEAFQEKQIRG